MSIYPNISTAELRELGWSSSDQDRLARERARVIGDTVMALARSHPAWAPLRGERQGDQSRPTRRMAPPDAIAALESPKLEDAPDKVGGDGDSSGDYSGAQLPASGPGVVVGRTELLPEHLATLVMDLIADNWTPEDIAEDAGVPVALVRNLASLPAGRLRTLRLQTAHAEAILALSTREATR